MTRLRLPLTLLAAGLALAAGAASAQDGDQSPPPDNGMQNYVPSTLGQLIFVSPSGQPFRALVGQPYPLATWFAQADADHDGKISADEFDKDASNFFDAIDTNHDGYISSPENTFYETNVAPEITHMDPRIAQPEDNTNAPDPDMDPDPNGDKTHYVKQILGASQYGLIDEPQPIRAADQNFDFRISASEWSAATAQRFAILDTNGDGFITMDELPKTPLQLYLEAPKDAKHKGHGDGGRGGGHHHGGGGGGGGGGGQ